MGQTISKARCPECEKQGRDLSGNNLTTFIGESGKEITKCMRPGCTYTNNWRILPMNSTEYQEVPENNILKDRGINTSYYLNVKYDCLKDALVFVYKNLNATIEYKKRYKDKTFSWDNKSKKTNMYNLSTCINYNKPLYITEGEIDQLTLAHLDYQACSVTSGAGSILECLKNDKDYLDKFETIVLCFDNDEAGKLATDQAIKFFNYRKIYKVDYKDLQEKDINDIYTKQYACTDILDHYIECIPEGIIFGDKLKFEDLWINPKPGIKLPWPLLNNGLKGLHRGMFYMLFGGSSIGKSSVLRELVYYLRINEPKLKIANLFLEEDQVTNPLAYIALDQNIPLGELLINRELIPKQNRKEIEDRLLNTDKLMFTNEQYELDSDELLNKLTYLAKVQKYDIIVIDHISMIISATQSKEGERRDIDILMKNLLKLCKQTGVIIVSACHLNDPDNKKNWDEGVIPSLYNGRGSRALAQKPDFIIGLSRNMKDQFSKDLMKLHILKNRWFAVLGEMDTLTYISRTGRLK